MSRQRVFNFGRFPRVNCWQHLLAAPDPAVCDSTLEDRESPEVHMFHPTKSLRGVAATALALTGLLSWPALAAADVSGEAAAVKANVLGVTTLLGTLTPSINTALSDTGSLTGAG